VNAAYQRIAYWKIGEPPEHEGAAERAGQRSAVHEPLHAAVQPPLGGEDRRDEPDQQDLHRHERPGSAGDHDRLLVEA
jgi:hypothetical protein